MFVFNITDLSNDPKRLKILGHQLGPGKDFPIDRKTYLKHKKKLDKLVRAGMIWIGSALPQWALDTRRKIRFGEPEGAEKAPEPAPEPEEDDSAVDKYLEERQWAVDKRDVMEILEGDLTPTPYRSWLVKACELLELESKGNKPDLAKDIVEDVAAGGDEVPWGDLKALLTEGEI